MIIDFDHDNIKNYFDFYELDPYYPSNGDEYNILKLSLKSGIEYIGVNFYTMEWLMHQYLKGSPIGDVLTEISKYTSRDYDRFLNGKWKK